MVSLVALQLSYFWHCASDLPKHLSWTLVGRIGHVIPIWCLVPRLSDLLLLTDGSSLVRQAVKEGAREAMPSMDPVDQLTQTSPLRSGRAVYCPTLFLIVQRVAHHVSLEESHAGFIRGR